MALEEVQRVERRTRGKQWIFDGTYVAIMANQLGRQLEVSHGDADPAAYNVLVPQGWVVLWRGSSLKPNEGRVQALVCHRQNR